VNIDKKNTKPWLIGVGGGPFMTTTNLLVVVRTNL